MLSEPNKQISVFQMVVMVPGTGYNSEINQG